MPRWKRCVNATDETLGEALGALFAQKTFGVDGKAKTQEIITYIEQAMEENLNAALALIDTDDQQLLESFYFERLSHKEIAEQLDVTPKAVSSRLERAREKLRAALAKILIRET